MRGTIPSRLEVRGRNRIDELKPADVPGPKARWSTISRFALTFDGVRYHGSFEKCAAIANIRRSRSLTDLRTCLFFEQRRWHHFGYPPGPEAMEYIRGLVARIRQRLANTGAQPNSRRT